MASAAYGLRLPASASCLGRHSRLAGRCPNNSSLFPPLAAVVVVASHIQRKDYFKFRVCRALRSAPNAFSREGFRTNSLSQNLTVLPAPSGREPLARPQTLHFSRELCRHAKGPILEGAVERSETGGVLLKTKRTSSEEPVRHGRGSKFRTHGTRFWRPLLYQLSYTPIYIR